MSKLKVNEVEINGYMGIEHLKLVPGTVTVISGPNGIGKTSVLEALRSIARGGDDTDSIRDTARERRVKLTLEDGTTIVRQQARNDEGGFRKPSLTVDLPGIGPIGKAQTFVESLFDEIAIDPWDLINCPPAKRAEYLKDILTVEVEDEALLAGIPDVPGVKMDALRKQLSSLLSPKMNGFEKVEAVREAVYAMRTEQNVIVKSKKASAADIRATLASEDASGRPIVVVKDELAILDGQLSRELAMADQERDMAKQAAYDERKRRDAAIDADIDARVRALEAERATRRTEVNVWWVGTEKTAGEAHSARHAAIHKNVGENRSALVTELAGLEERARTAAATVAQRAIAEKSEKEAQAAEARAKGLTAAIEKMDEEKRALLSALPVAGLEIRNKVVYLDGRPWEKVNTARQIEVAVEIAALRAGKCGLIVTDHGEALDAASMAVLVETAKAKGLQVVMAVVEKNAPNELKVEVTE